MTHVLSKGCDQGLASSHSPQGLLGCPTQCHEVFRTEVGQLVRLAVAPDVVHGIEFRDVSGQEVRFGLSVLDGHEVRGQTAGMKGQPCPHDGEVAGDVLLQVLQREDELWGFGVAGEELKVEVSKRDARDSILQDRNLTGWRPTNCAPGVPARSGRSHAYRLWYRAVGALFAHGGPTDLPPALNGRFVAFGGQLATPAHRAQDVPEVPGLRCVAGLPLEEVDQALGAFQGCAVSQDLRSLAQSLAQALELLGAQSGLALGAGRLLEPGFSLAVPAPMPAAGGFPGDPSLGGEFGLVAPLVEEAGSLNAALFQLLKIRFGGFRVIPCSKL